MKSIPVHNTVEKIVAVVEKVLDCKNDTCIFSMPVSCFVIAVNLLALYI